MITLDNIMKGLSEAELSAIEHRFIVLGRVMERAPLLIMPVGAPGTGKSTWIKAHLATTDRPTVVLSSDDQIEELARAQGKTYSEVHSTIDMKQLESVMSGSLRVAVASRKDIIVDRTNLRVKSRRRWMSQVPKHYLRVGLVFELPLAILHQRLLARGVATGKVIPNHAITDMLDSYQVPTTEEFDIVGFMREEATQCSTN